MLLSGAGMLLSGDAHAVELRAPFEPYAFSGDDGISCALVDGPVRDFNLMLRRGRVAGRIVVVRDAAERIAPARWRVCHATGGPIECLVPGHPPVAVALDDTDRIRGRERIGGRRAGDQSALRRRGGDCFGDRARALKLFAHAALLPTGWADDVLIEIGAGGDISRVSVNASPEGAERAAGPLVPGMSNLHSHAFQRALAGRTGGRSADGDSFWTWRQAMYAFLDASTPTRSKRLPPRRTSRC